MFKNRYRDLREDFDFKQRDIANILKVSCYSYSAWEREINSIPLDKLNELGKLYQVSLDYLLGLSHNKNRKIANKDIHLFLLYKRLKEVRKQFGYSQETVGNLVGFSQTTYSSYERGETLIPTFKLLLISQLYHVSFDYLVGKKDDLEILK